MRRLGWIAVGFFVKPLVIGHAPDVGFRTEFRGWIEYAALVQRGLNISGGLGCHAGPSAIISEACSHQLKFFGQIADLLRDAG